MTVATALVSGNDPLPQLAEAAVEEALARAGLTHANGVLLFLTPEFARHAQATVTAVARRARCTQVSGSIASGVFTESGWTLDRPAAAVMLLGGGLSLGRPDNTPQALISLAGNALPADWLGPEPRVGATYGGVVNVEPGVWQQSRMTEQQQCTVQVLGASLTTGLSSGLRLLGKPQKVESSSAYDLKKLGGRTALASLHRALPTELRQRNPLPWHHLAAVLMDENLRTDDDPTSGRYRPLAIIAANADASLTLAEQVSPGQFVGWALREPITAEADMQQVIEKLAGGSSSPVGALMFSCIGRGPYFYGGEDRDLNVMRSRFPGLPILGTYGSGQIAPAPDTLQGNRELQNAVVVALLCKTRKAHVQSIA